MVKIGKKNSFTAFSCFKGAIFSSNEVNIKAATKGTSWILPVIAEGKIFIGSSPKFWYEVL